ncbi:MAG: outer membrane beta-barrel protein [Bacteroidota bacterium]
MKTIPSIALLLIAGWLPANFLLAHQIIGILEAEGAPLEYATVSAFNEAGELVEGTVTTADGQFAIELEAGSYRFLFEFIGFAEKEQLLNIDGPMDLGVISLSEAGVDLEAITVTAERSQLNLSLDKKVFNVGQDLLSRGGSANQVLEQLPSIQVSVDGVVSYRGNSGVRVLINGRPSALANNNALESIPAESIERVEIITNPSARYEAAGTAGIINIILKKEQAGGYGGTLSLSAGYPADHRLNLNLNYRRAKWSAFFNGGLRYSNYNGSTDLDRMSQAALERPILDQNADQDRNDQAGNLFTGVDVQLNENTSVAANYSLYRVINDDIQFTDYLFSDLAGNSVENQTQVQDYLEPGTYHQLDFSLNKAFAKGELNFYFQNDLWLEQESEAITLDQWFPTSINLLDYRTNTDESSRDHLIQLDYERPLGEQGRLELGLRGETRIISADYLAERKENDTYVPIPGFSNDYDYFERIGAAYMQASQEWGRFSAQLGLRTEYTYIKTENAEEAELPNIEKDYIRLFPSMAMSYRFSETNSTQLSYSRRLRRPSFWQLNPFAGINDPNQLFVGNPDMDPAFTDRLELNYLLQSDKWTINPAIYASRTIDFFSQFTEQVGDNLFGLEAGTVLSRPLNLEREDQYGFELITNYRADNGFSIGTEFNFYGADQRGQFRDEDLSANFSSWSAGLRTQIDLIAGIRFQGRFSYNAPRAEAQFRSLAQVVAFMGVSKRWDDRFTLNFNVRSPRYWNSEAFAPGFQQTLRQSWTIWRFSLTGSYRFERGAESRERRARGSIR